MSSLNAEVPIIVNVVGNIIVPKLPQLANALVPIVVVLVFDKSMLVSFEQPSNALSPIAVIVFGREIEMSDEHCEKTFCAT